MLVDHNPVGWFEIPTRDMARAQGFYERLFQIELQPFAMPNPDMRMMVFPMFPQKKGAAGALICGKGYEPADKGVKIYFTAPDLNAHTQRAADAGGFVIAEKFAIGDNGFVAIVQDPDGNIIGLHSLQG